MRRSTWVLLAILLLIALFWYLVQNGQITLPGRGAGTGTPTLQASGFLYVGEGGSITGIKVQDDEGNAVAIRRGPGGTWSLLEPEITAADLALAESAATQAAALRILTEVEEDFHPQVVGLGRPAYTITLETASGDHVFLVGNPTVTGSGYYVKTMDGNIVVVTTFGIDALTNLLAIPPYAETPTPSPEATVTPARTP